MSLDNLLGLLFFILFVVLPALRSLSRRPNPAEDDEGQESMPEQRPLPPQPQPPVVREVVPPPAAPRPVRPQPVAREILPSPAPQRPVRPQSVAPPEAARPRSRSAESSAEADPWRAVQTVPTPPAPPVPPASTQSRKRTIIAARPEAILSGMVWREVLAEPRGQYWLRRRTSRKPRL